jgi:PAS domain S-box-containing protein
MTTAIPQPKHELSQTDFASFFMLSPDLLCIAGLDGQFRFVNPAWQSTFGFTTEELTSRPFMDFIHPEDRDATNATYASQIKQGLDVIEFENRYLCKNGTYRWLVWNARTLPDKQLIYAVARDVTSVKAAEQALERKNQELEVYTQELKDFTHVVSHDLKEPLRAISAFSGFLSEEYADKLDETGRRYVDILAQSAERMRDLIDDLLALAEVGRTKPDISQVDMGAVIERMRETMAFTLRDKNVDLRVPRDLPTILGNATRFAQVFENLVTNAIKYNDKPTPVIEIAYEGCDDGVRFCVRDNGPGIPVEYREKVFQIFQRLVRRDEHEGTGIGLAICKKIVEGRGGAIWIESNPGGDGCSFYFTIPTAAPTNNDVGGER